MSTTYYGALPDNFSIDSDGGTNYTIPIELPPGTAKMMPNISIGYNSGGGNGLLGMGWQLLGLSSITRVKATVAQDGFPRTINYDENDRFALDGDGKTDLVVLTESSNSLLITPIACLSPVPDLMTTITNGLRGQYSLTYKPVTDSTVYSESGSGLTGSVEVRSIFSTKVSGASYQVSNMAPAQAASGASYTTRRVDFPKYVVAGYEKSDWPWSLIFVFAVLQLSDDGFHRPRLAGVRLDRFN